MPASAHVPTTLISLRPAGQHGALRHAAARHGLAVLGVSPWRLQPREDAATRGALGQALAAPVVVFTSPAAVRAAGRLAPLRPPAAARWLAVGEGSAGALRRAGVAEVIQPARMDSEGLLALPALAGAARVGLVTAPGGRGLLASTLAGRGVEVVRADVYERVPLALTATTLRRLHALTGPSVLALSSGEALERVLDQLPAELLARWQAQPVVAASQRLAAQAAARGFQRIVQAEGPRPAQLLAAALAAD
ncbi:uroporphyrinogen-III synthase [Stenotrophomonas sp. HITSZ_GD]|uniref:uroporphyrinogen-III synthase n=1 Tax=Stenotrophomonas sp. HITSZ_GD TaxID=3037248 RepID=UPI00240CFB7C|nr:uroporphyrinogen-III synthase [Stenotrophomonas sp. HITSZ_GD]MDG2523923.1 uroporphyrinogen-III synthase [Stenotrophomonas sp. HITSZ_GD]